MKAYSRSRHFQVRTRAALAAKKAQGAVLGNQTNLAEAAAKVAAAQRTAADAFAANVLPVVRQIQAAGATTHRAIAEALNARGIRTARGGVFRPVVGWPTRWYLVCPPFYFRSLSAAPRGGFGCTAVSRLSSYPSDVTPAGWPYRIVRFGGVAFAGFRLQPQPE